MDSEVRLSGAQQSDNVTPAQPPSARHRARGSQSAKQSGARSRNDDSWIEVSSQPSSSSLSSATDEIITTGLRVQHDSNARRIRPQRHSRRSVHRPRRSRSVGGHSSQEEYEESESESDRVMTSSSEGLQISPLHQEWRPAQQSSGSSENPGNEDEEEDDDENVTTINGTRGQVPRFQPQPNAFNRPPSRHGTPTYSQPASTRPALRSGSHRHSYPAQATQHSPYNVVSPSYQADHDAALRASLSTLLSCAAAARGLPKSNNVGGSAPAPSSRVEPSALRIVPESVVLGTSPPRTSGNDTAPAAAQHRANSSSSPRSRSADRSKRASSNSDRQASSSKKVRRLTGSPPSAYGLGGVADVSPTLLTWVVSAGVVVLVGALSFSAGYAVGREAGYAEAMGGGGGGGGLGGAACGMEQLAVTSGGGGGVAGGAGLRRLQWTDALTV